MKWPSELVLVRHGESEANKLTEKKLQDPEMQKLWHLCEIRDTITPEIAQLAQQLRRKYSYPRPDWQLHLTERGREQARQTALALRQEMGLPQTVFLSPYLRAIETYEAMRETCPELPDLHDTSHVYQDNCLREFELGRAELNGDITLFLALHPEEKEWAEFTGTHHYRFPGGENAPDMLGRVQHWIERVVRDCSDQNVLVVTHDRTILGARHQLERWESEDFIAEEKARELINCGVTRYVGDSSLGENGRLVLQYYNRKLHSC